MFVTEKLTQEEILDFLEAALVSRDIAFNIYKNKKELLEKYLNDYFLDSPEFLKNRYVCMASRNIYDQSISEKIIELIMKVVNTKKSAELLIGRFSDRKVAKTIFFVQKIRFITITARRVLESKNVFISIDIKN